MSVRCPDADCLSGATATTTIGGRERTLRAAAIEPPERGYGRLVLRPRRVIRRELARGRSVRALVSVYAADAAANVSARRRAVTAAALSTLGRWQGTRASRAPTLSTTSAARAAGARWRGCQRACAGRTT